MKSLKRYRLLTAAAATVFFVGAAWAENSPAPTVEAKYPALASGALAYARPAVLPDGVLLKAEGVVITKAEIEQAIGQQPPQVRAILEKNPFYVLEQEAAGKLLVRAAHNALDGQEQSLDETDDEQLINTLFDKLTRDVAATEEEQREFYRHNPQFFPDMSFERVQPQIAQYLAREMKQHVVEDYICTLGRLMTIEVSEDWTTHQAAIAFDNPLDKARQNGKPTVAMFYAASACCPDTMGPVLAAIDKQFGDKLNVVTVNPGTEPILAARYKVRGNPYLVFFGADGKETFRQQGAMSRQQVDVKLAEISVK
jgi:thioredoxin 1